MTPAISHSPDPASCYSAPLQVAVLWPSPGYPPAPPSQLPHFPPRRFSLTVESPPAEAQRLHDSVQGQSLPCSLVAGPTLKLSLQSSLPRIKCQACCNGPCSSPPLPSLDRPQHAADLHLSVLLFQLLPWQGQPSLSITSSFIFKESPRMLSCSCSQCLHTAGVNLHCCTNHSDS